MGTKIQKGPLTADEVEQCKAFLGPPPVLSTAEESASGKVSTASFRSSNRGMRTR